MADSNRTSTFSEGVVASATSIEDILNKTKINSLQNLEFQEEDEMSEMTETGLSNTPDSGEVQLPYVTITKISLDPTGGDIVPENNPHIDDIDGANISVDQFGNIQFASKSINYLTKTTTPAGLKVNLKLSIKEMLKSNDTVFQRAAGDTIVVSSSPGTGTWFDNDELLKYLNIRIVESANSELTEQLKLAEYDIDPKSYVETDLRKYANEKILSVKNEIQSDLGKYDSYIDANGNRIYDVVFETSFFHNNASPGHLTYFAHAYLDVDQIAADYGCGSGNLAAADLDKRHGYTVAESVINSSAVSRNGFAYYTPEKRLWTGPIYHKSGTGFTTSLGSTGRPLNRTVVENTKIEDHRDELNLEKAEFEFSIIENNLLSLKLTSLERSTADVKRTAEYFSQLYGTRDAEGRFRAIIGFNYQKFLRDNTQFGKLFMNKNLAAVEPLADSCKILLAKVIRERVENLESLNSLGSIIEGRVPYGTRESGIITNSVPPETITYSSSKKGKMLSPYTRNVTPAGQAVEKTEKNKSVLDSVRPAGHIREINLYPTTDKNIRHFSFADHRIAAATDGLYRYGIEITIEDGTKDYLVKVSKDLLMIKKQLEQYYNHATVRTNGKQNYNIVNSKYIQSFINLKNSQYPSPKNGKIRGNTKVTHSSATGEKDPLQVRRHQHKFIVDARGTGRTELHGDHYHKISNFKVGPAIKKGKRKPIPASHMHSCLVRASRTSAPWIQPVATYMRILDLFSAGQHNIDISKLSGMLYKMLSPESGRPEYILRFIKLIDNLYQKIHTIVGTPKTLNSSHPNSATKAQRSVKVLKMFDEIFDSNVEKKVGYDYLDDGDYTLHEAGLYMIDGKNYVTRAQKEETKYFCEDSETTMTIRRSGADYISGDLLSNNSLSFLSPASVELGQGKKMNLLTGCNKEEEMWPLFELEAEIVDFNLNASKGVSSISVASSQDKYASAAAVEQSSKNFLTALNVTVADITEKSLLGISVALPQTVQRCIENVDTYLGTDSPMIRANLTPQKLVGAEHASRKSVSQSIAMETGGTLSFMMSPIKSSTFNPSSSPASAFSTTTSTQSFLNVEFDLSNSYNALTGVPPAEFLQLPNQIKSLFLESSPNRRLLITAGQSDTTTQAAVESVLRFNTQLLREVEVFAGYEIRDDGDVMVKSPRWTNLTYDLYNNSVEQTLLCRLRSYENSSVNVGTSALIELPVYNEYFLLKIKTAEVVKTSNRTRVDPRDYRQNMENSRVNIDSAVKETTGKEKIPANLLGANMLISRYTETTEAIEQESSAVTTGRSSSMSLGGSGYGSG